MSRPAFAAASAVIEKFPSIQIVTHEDVKRPCLRNKNSEGMAESLPALTDRTHFHYKAFQLTAGEGNSEFLGFCKFALLEDDGGRRGGSLSTPAGCHLVSVAAYPEDRLLAAHVVVVLLRHVEAACVRRGVAHVWKVVPADCWLRDLLGTVGFGRCRCVGEEERVDVGRGVHVQLCKRVGPGGKGWGREVAREGSGGGGGERPTKGLRTGEVRGAEVVGGRVGRVLVDSGRERKREAKWEHGEKDSGGGEERLTKRLRTGEDKELGREEAGARETLAEPAWGGDSGDAEIPSKDPTNQNPKHTAIETLAEPAWGGDSGDAEIPSKDPTNQNPKHTAIVNATTVSQAFSTSPNPPRHSLPPQAANPLEDGEIGEGTSDLAAQIDDLIREESAKLLKRKAEKDIERWAEYSKRPKVRGTRGRGDPRNARMKRDRWQGRK